MLSFRKQTQGFTGHPKAIRDINVEKGRERYEEIIKKMDEIVEKEFCIEPNVANQFVRGDLYFHVHAVMMWQRKLSP